MIRGLVVAYVIVLSLYLSFGLAGASHATEEGRSPESNLPYLFAAFAVTWVGFFAYLLYISHRERELRREMRALRKTLEEQENPGQEESRKSSGE